jgi:hypothetical protein
MEGPTADAGKVSLFEFLPAFSKVRVCITEQLIHGTVWVRPLRRYLFLNHLEHSADVSWIAPMEYRSAKRIDLDRRAGSKVQMSSPGRRGGVTKQLQAE